MKIIDRNKTIEKEQEKFVESEVCIMKHLLCDYVVKLYYTFQNDDNLFFVMEYINGGDLKNLLANIGSIEIKYCRVYVAEIALALRYLHSNEICHRDLKPDNILIDGTGHLKLTDFGLSQMALKSEQSRWVERYLKKETPSSKPEGIVGSPHYLAPEVISEGRGGTAADWWALGIIMYEMLVGDLPYNGDSPKEVFQNILSDLTPVVDKIKNEGLEEEISEEAIDLMQRFLSRDPKQRIGLEFEVLKSHPFFNGLNWDNLRDEEPPFVPSVSDITDISYFSEEKQFIPCISKQKSAPSSRKKSILLDFKFTSTNAKSLAEQNLVALKNITSTPRELINP